VLFRSDATVSLLIEAVKEQQEMIIELKERVKQLEDSASA
jgi:hypothetical protein